MHANNWRKFYLRVDEAVCHSIMLMSPELCDDVTVKCNTAIIYDDVDFGEVMVIDTHVCVNGDVFPSQKIKPETFVLSNCVSTK